MLVSNCCGHPVEVYEAVTKHYRCKMCGETCDVEDESLIYTGGWTTTGYIETKVINKLK